MNITIVDHNSIPVQLYGGTQRVVWYLGKELALLGHKVTFLVEQGSYCDFASVLAINHDQDIWEQIPEDTDVVHFHFVPKNTNDSKFPYLVTVHGNAGYAQLLDKNSVFVSKNHAERHGSDSFVYNGLDWTDYTTPSFSKKQYFHFLGKAAWRIKNVKGAIEVVKKAPQAHLKVLGGYRFNFKMGVRFTFSRKASFYGLVGGEEKNRLLDQSKGLIFPVLWHEPFGLALIESLYYGCPVFATPYGSIPELIPEEFGRLSNRRSTLTKAIENADSYSQKHCHQYAVDCFNSKKMALSYLNKYESVCNGHSLNKTQPTLINKQEVKFLDWFE